MTKHKTKHAAAVGSPKALADSLEFWRQSDRVELRGKDLDLCVKGLRALDAGQHTDALGAVDFETFAKLERAHSHLVDAQEFLFDARCEAGAAAEEAVYATAEKLRDRMRQALLSPAFVDDPIARFRTLKRAVGVDGVVSPLMIHLARAFADSAERALASPAST